MKLSRNVLGAPLALLMTFAVADNLPSGPSGTVQFRESSTHFSFEATQSVVVRLRPSGLNPLPEYSGFGIYPLSEDVVFIYGSLNTPGFDVQSLLLRSEDGGQSWREVDMTLLASSQVTKVLFLDENAGWATVAWTVESPGEVWLFGTSDGGKSWERLSLVMEYAAGSWLARIKFFDSQHGQLLLYHDKVSTPSDGIEILETADGGKTWESIVRLRLGLIAGERYDGESEEGTRIGLVTDEIYKQLREQLSKVPKPFAAARDGSQWRMTLHSLQDDGMRGEPNYSSPSTIYISVQRRLNSEASWEERAFLPEYYEIKNGSSVPVPLANRRSSDGD